jgi:thioredoxin reductase/ferredoxin
VAWEAARDVARRVPWLGGGPAGALRTPSPWLWVGGAVGVALAVLLVQRGARERWRARARRATPQVPLVAATRVRLPQINTTTCLGCYACVDACPFDVLTIERYVAVVARPADCCGVVLCAQVCPNGSLVIAEGEAIDTRPRVDEHLESLDAPGVFLAGDLTGLPLIKNAIRQGRVAVDRIAATRGARPARRDGELDVAIIGAGPAGLSASLRAAELGLAYVTLEQGAFAASIRNFPRNKLVFDQPIQLPLEGDLWLREATKEELLAQWTRIVRSRRLLIRERHRVVDVTRDGEGFRITCAEESGATVTFAAARLLLAIGKRGTPRELDATIADAAESKVSYALADAKTFAGKRVLIVGLGDAAMEAAVAIARQPGAEVTVCHRGDGFARGRPRNIAEMKSLAAHGRIRIVFGARVAAVDVPSVTLDVAGRRETLANDAVIALIGGVPSWELVAKAGVRAGTLTPAVPPAPASVDSPEATAT